MKIIAAIAAVLMVVGVSTPASASIPYRTKIENRIAWAVFHEINRERAEHGLRRVWHCPMLRLSSRRHDVRMARADTLSHQLPGEATPRQRERNAGYYPVWSGENIAWNSVMTKAGAIQLERLMYHEKAPYNDHRLNILSHHYRAVGVDVYLAGGKLWLTTDFGRRY